MAYRKSGGRSGGSKRGGVRRKSYSGKAGRARGGQQTVKLVIEHVQQQPMPLDAVAGTRVGTKGLAKF